ncbi:MAG: H4MPT-linked C1 transfer pathway protein [Planctomycetales bacterium 71-10]|nr:MAG: H4MPT-linked C1 transfer pathway protein [Planctomycetales bacterium 71-10]
MPVGRKEAGLPPRWLAVDIGGANLKAAHSGGAVKASPFAVWRDPIGLAAALKGLAAGLPPFESIAVTMTAELCDCFETKRDGVRRVVDAVIEAFDVPDLLFWGTDGAFHDHKATLRDPLVAAASNWLGLATVAAGLVGDGPAVLIDVGSTTTDVIPMAASGVAARGRTDTERLRNGELIYAGVSRTPVCALAAELPFQGSPTGLAAELFATTRDVYLVLGDLPGDPGDSSTADGRAATRDRAVDRMARMACADRESCSADDVLDLARAADRALFDRLLASARRACAATIGTPTTAVVSGSGEFLARRIAEALVGPSGTVRSLAELWGPAASDAACARALLELAAKWEAERAGE